LFNEEKSLKIATFENVDNEAINNFLFNFFVLIIQGMHLLSAQNVGNIFKYKKKIRKTESEL